MPVERFVEGKDNAHGSFDFCEADGHGEFSFILALIQAWPYLSKICLEFSGKSRETGMISMILDNNTRIVSFVSCDLYLISAVNSVPNHVASGSFFHWLGFQVIKLIRTAIVLLSTGFHSSTLTLEILPAPVQTHRYEGELSDA